MTTDTRYQTCIVFESGAEKQMDPYYSKREAIAQADRMKSVYPTARIVVMVFDPADQTIVYEAGAAVQS